MNTDTRVKKKDPTASGKKTGKRSRLVVILLIPLVVVISIVGWWTLRDDKKQEDNSPQQVTSPIQGPVLPPDPASGPREAAGEQNASGPPPGQLLLQAIQEEKSGKHDNAQALYRQLLREPARQARDYYEYSGYWLRRKEADSALRVAQEGLAAFPKDAPLYVRISEVYFGLLRQPARAMEALKKAAMLDPGNQKILYNIGWLYYNDKDFPQAETYLMKAYRLDSVNRELTSLLSLTLMELGKKEQAEYYLRKLTPKK